MMVLQQQAQSSAPAAFTLVEVILAISIALGILLVLLFFYQQATNLRGQAIQETERIAAARLVMDRMTGELRALQPESPAQSGFIGRSNWVEFVKAEVPALVPWTGGTLGRSASPVTDRKRVRYQLQSVDGTNAPGLLRSEEPMVPRARLTMEDEISPTNAVTAASAPAILEEIRLLQFRYWSGTNWLDTWSWPDPPEGVEIRLGAEALTNETEAVEESTEVFRRVVYLPVAELARRTAALPALEPSTSGEEAP